MPDYAGREDFMRIEKATAVMNICYEANAAITMFNTNIYTSLHVGTPIVTILCDLAYQLIFVSFLPQEIGLSTRRTRRLSDSDRYYPMPYIFSHPQRV